MLQVFSRREKDLTCREVNILQESIGRSLVHRMVLQEHLGLGLWGSFRCNRTGLSVLETELSSCQLGRLQDYLFRSR